MMGRWQGVGGCGRWVIVSVGGVHGGGMRGGEDSGNGLEGGGLELAGIHVNDKWKWIDGVDDCHNNSKMRVG